jgi:hypothetical protein
MAETQTYDWDSVDVDETISEADQKASENLSTSTPVGKFLVTIAESNAVERTFKAYSCIAANLKMQIDSVIELEQPVFDDKGQPVKRNGETLLKRLPVTGDAKTKADALYVGRFIFDDVNLYHVSEKEAMKKRRIFVAKKIGLITSDSQKLTGRMWGEGILGMQVIVTTEYNSWKDKDTGEMRRNVRVAWDGYESAVPVETVKDDDFLDI